MIHESRQGVCDKLAAAFPGAEVVAGERVGVWRGETDLIAVWWSGYQVIARDISLASPTMTIRYFPTISKLPPDQEPRDPSPLEQAADALIVALDRPSQGVGYFALDTSWRLESMPAPAMGSELWHVEARLVAYTLGAAA